MKIFKDKNKRVALLGTLLFHVLILVILFSFYMVPPYPPRPEIGLEVNLGNSDEGMGEEQPETPKEEITTPPPQEQQVTEQTENVVTQEQEQTIKVNNKPKADKPKPKVEEQPVEEKPKIDDRFVFKKKKKSGGSEGVTGKPGDQGRENGTPDAKNYVGDGGNGISFSLKGRKSKSLPRPAYDSDEQGTVVVKVWVNKSGKVINAVVLEKGTTTADSRLRDMAVKAAKRAQFDANPEAPEVQTGTITYDFILLN